MLYRMTTNAPIFGLRREIDRLFDDTFTRDGFNWSPAVDIKETEGVLEQPVDLSPEPENRRACGHPVKHFRLLLVEVFV